MDFQRQWKLITLFPTLVDSRPKIYEDSEFDSEIDSENAQIRILGIFGFSVAMVENRIKSVSNADILYQTIKKWKNFYTEDKICILNNEAISPKKG